MSAKMPDDALRREFGDPDLEMDKQHEIFLRGIIHDVNNNLMAIMAACDQWIIDVSPILIQMSLPNLSGHILKRCHH